MNTKNGSTLLIIAFVVTFASEVMVTSLEVMAEGPQAIGANGIRILLTAGLCYGIWIGLAWTRWIMVVLTGLAFVMSVGAAIASGAVPVWMFAMKYAFILYVLAIDKSVSAFIKSQKEAREAPSSSAAADRQETEDTDSDNAPPRTGIGTETIMDQTVAMKSSRDPEKNMQD